MHPARFTILILSMFFCCPGYAQNDSSKVTVQNIPLSYIRSIKAKTEKYNSRVSSKTEKTLTRLGKWENKIHVLLQKADPVADAKLFGPGKLTFSSMLKNIRDGQALEEKYNAKYDGFRDKLTVNIKYITSKKDSLDAKYLQPLKKTTEEQKELDKNITQSEAAEKLIGARKKELINEAMKVLGKNKYLSKINKESYYYTETLKNYKEIFNDPVKTEATVKGLLDKIPAFSKFMKENSMLASLFGGGGGAGNPGQPIPGLQLRTDVNAMIDQRVASGGPNARAIIAQNMHRANVQLSELKNRILKAGGGSSDASIPDFKPNTQRSKTFKQRLQIGSEFQISKPSNVQPATADMGLSIGYKLNDKSIAGISVSYKMGYGSIQRLNITHQGVGLRSFIDWKIKKQLFVSGGYEMNYNAAFKNLHSLGNYDDWQSSGLVGLTKKLKVKTKLFKETKFQLLYDMMFRRHSPVTQPVIFRVGYNF